MKEKNLQFEFFCGSGPGGQHRNRKKSGVRVTHLTSGLSAVCQEDRSQAKNKEKALKNLTRKLELFRQIPKRRIKTKKSARSKERVLHWKKKRGLKKLIRRGIDLRRAE